MLGANVSDEGVRGAGLGDDGGLAHALRNGVGGLSYREATPESLGSVLAGELALAETGIAFIYRCLAVVVVRWGLADAMAVIEEPTLGRQVFRHGRRPPDTPWAKDLALGGGPGLHTDPVLPDEADDVAVAFDLCRVALRLDMARYDSLHDSLTGLYNRRCFEDLLDQAVDRSRRYGWSFSLVFIDLDHFKVINDEHGHDAGDLVLRAIGEEMRHALRRGDVAARIGGDEFALLLPATEPDFVPTLLDRLNQGVAQDQDRPTVGFSTGAASCPEEAVDVEDLRRLADGRLYEAKARPRGRDRGATPG